MPARSGSDFQCDRTLIALAFRSDSPERISAVQYTRYPLSPEAKAALLAPGTPIAVEIDHPNYRYRVQCSEELRASLAADYGA